MFMDLKAHAATPARGRSAASAPCTEARYMDCPGDWTNFEEPYDYGQTEDRVTVNFYLSQRLDSLLPLDPALGVVAPVATRVYLGAAMEMVVRSGQPLSLLAIAVDVDVAGGRRPGRSMLGAGDSGMVAQAVARCLRQETRLHDVVGLVQSDDQRTPPVYLIVCPLIDESHAAQLGERLRAAMMSFALDPADIGIQVNVGVASLSLSTVEPESLITRAAEALQCARRVEGGCVWKHSDSSRRLSSDGDDDLQ
jgi:GGDEF domain-containing protein